MAKRLCNGSGAKDRTINQLQYDPAVAETTSVDNVKDGGGGRDRKEATHGHRQFDGADAEQREPQCGVFVSRTE